MGAKDIKRQRPNVEAIRKNGAQIVPVTTGSQTLVDAVSECMRYWVSNCDTTHMCVGSTVGPNIFIKICAWSTAQISRELMIQVKEEFGKIPRKMKLLNCVGGGATITGVTTFFNDLRAKGVIENVSAATTFYDANSKVVLELDLSASTTYSYSMGAFNIGIVSFKNMPADAQGGTTVTVLFTQASATTGGVGNTQSIVGLGTDCTVIPNVGGAAIAGISTRAFVGGGSTFVGLSTTPGDKEFVSFFVHYNGGTNTNANSYDIFVTKNGQFRPGSVGV